MHIWKSAAKSFLSPSTASQEPQPVRTCEDNLEAKSLEWSWLGKKARKRNGGDSSPAQILLLGSSLLIPRVPQEWHRMSFCGTYGAFSACLSLCPVQQQVCVQTICHLPMIPDNQQWPHSLHGGLQGSERRLVSSAYFLPLKFHLPVSESWEHVIYIYLLLRLFLMGCYVCKGYEFLWGIQWLLNRERIILSIPQKGFFSLAHLFSESSIYIPTTNRQASIRISWSSYWISKWGRNQSDSIVLARSLLGPLFQNHLLVKFTSCSGFLQGESYYVL